VRRPGQGGAGRRAGAQRHRRLGDPAAAAADLQRGGRPRAARQAGADRASLPRRRPEGLRPAPEDSAPMAIKHFLRFDDFSREELDYLFSRTRFIKDRFKRYQPYHPLADRTLVMIFEKASTRTRLSFEAGMHQLGGAAIYLTTRASQRGRGEPVEDAAQVISRMCDIVMIRTFEQTIVERFAAHSRVPVINGLTNEYHPCQVLADVFTYAEHRGSLEGRIVAWVGDANNMSYTWIQAARLLGFMVHVCTPAAYPID